MAQFVNYAAELQDEQDEKETDLKFNIRWLCYALGPSVSPNSKKESEKRQIGIN